MWSIEMKTFQRGEDGHVCSAMARRVHHHGRGTLSSLTRTDSSVLAS